MKPTSQEYEAAVAAGESCRRAGGKRTANPYQFGRTEPFLTLADAWDVGWLRADGRRA